MNVEYCELSSSFPKVTQHGMQYYVPIKLTWRQFSVKAFLVRVFKMTISTRCREHRWFLYPQDSRNTRNVQWNGTIPRKDASSKLPSRSQCNEAVVTYFTVLPNRRSAIGAGNWWWWWCSVMSRHMWCSLGCFVVWSQTDKSTIWEQHAQSASVCSFQFCCGCQ